MTNPLYQLLHLLTQILNCYGQNKWKRVKLTFSEDSVNKWVKGRKRKACPTPFMSATHQEDSHYRTGFLSYSLAYDRPICSRVWYSSKLLVKAFNSKSIASKKWCLSEDKGSLLHQHCCLIYSLLLLKFKLLEISLATHPKLGPCRHGSPIVVELSIHCPPPFPCPVAPLHFKK